MKIRTSWGRRKALFPRCTFTFMQAQNWVIDRAKENQRREVKFPAVDGRDSKITQKERGSDSGWEQKTD